MSPRPTVREIPGTAGHEIHHHLQAIPLRWSGWYGARLIYSDGTKDRFNHSMLTGEVQRARRYEVAIAIQYRQRRRRGWRSGKTQNVSASGVLFGEAPGDAQLQLRAPLEMELTIPSNVPGGPVTRILCSGRVSRIVDPGTSDRPRIVAATIAKYRLLRT